MNLQFVLFTPYNTRLAAHTAHEVAHYLADHLREQQRLQTLCLTSWLTFIPVAVTVGSTSSWSWAARGNMHPGIMITALQRWAFALPLSAGMAYLVYKFKCRELEYEADHIGMVLMKEAGYDPQSSVDAFESLVNLVAFCEKWSASDGSPPQPWHETHPLTATHPPVSTYYATATSRELMIILGRTNYVCNGFKSRRRVCIALLNTARMGVPLSAMSPLHCTEHERLSNGVSSRAIESQSAKLKQWRKKLCRQERCRMYRSSPKKSRNLLREGRMGRLCSRPSCA